MKKNKGFSLIELMIVVGIIGILSLIALPLYRDYMFRVRVTEIINDLMPFMKDAQVANGSGTPADFSLFSSDPPMACLMGGVEYHWVTLQGDEVSALGVDPKYVDSINVRGRAQACTPGYYDWIESANPEIFRIDITLNKDFANTGDNYNVITLIIPSMYINQNGKRIEDANQIFCVNQMRRALPHICRGAGLMYAQENAVGEAVFTY